MIAISVEFAIEEKVWSSRSHLELLLNGSNQNDDLKKLKKISDFIVVDESDR